ncbi:MAG: SDR family NAD(P)-dependent oxidoreductase, partial [Planctomycetota bacterium]
VTARSADRLEALATEIRDAGGRAVAVPADVSEKEEVFAAVERVVAELGPIDLAIANAGISADGADLDSTEYLYRVNVFGMLALFHAVLPSMRERGRGHLVGIASIAGYQAFPGRGAYCGSKAAMRMELEALRTELGPAGIAVTCVNPGFIRTPLTDRHDFDMPFLMDAEPAARKIVAAIGKRKAVYDFPWRMSMISRILRTMPRRWFDAFARKRGEGKPRTQAKSGET